MSIIILFLFSCGNFARRNRIVSVSLDPSGAIDVDKNFVTVYLNKNKIADTSVTNDHISNSKSVACLKIDSNQTNYLVIKVNYKQITIDLNKYHGRCVDIFLGYDNLIKIREGFKKMEIDSISKHRNMPDFRKYYNAQKKDNTKGQLDSLTCTVLLNECLCDSRVSK